MDFEDDASTFAAAEPEFASVPSPSATPVVEQLKAQLATLTPEERAELANFLIHSLDSWEEGAESAWEAEAARRLAEMQAGQVIAKPADQVFTELREKRS